MSSNFNSFPGLKFGFKFTIGTEAANAINVAVQVVDRDNGNEVGERVAFWAYISDDAEGDDLAATAPTGGAAIGTDGVFIETVDNKAGMAITESDGDWDVTLTDTGTPTFYLICVAPDGRLYPSGAITFA